MKFLAWPGKSASHSGVEHPAFYHMIDVGAVVELLVEPMNIPPPLKSFFALAAALHDLGKINNSFRDMLRSGTPQAQGRHWEVTEAWLRRSFDGDMSAVLPRMTARRAVYAAIAGHHGYPPYRETLEKMIAAAGTEAEQDARQALTELMALWPDAGCDFDADSLPAWTWWLPGLIAVADWIGSNPAFFPPHADVMPAAAYLERARDLAGRAVRAAGLDYPPLADTPVIPEEWTLRPMQKATQSVSLPDGPTLAIIEDETGSGKTEAALILAQRMMQAGKGAGLFFALPTMATANAMFDRAADLVGRLYKVAPSLALAHGRAGLSDRFRDLIRMEPTPGMPACTQWLADDRRRALLANVGIGTVDQALLSALPVRHAMLRHFALSGKILIVDEVHEMGDPYMAEELCRLLALHRRIGGSAILMTATMPVALRSRLCAAFQCPAPEGSDYPALTVAGHQTVTNVASVNARGPVRVARLNTVLDAVEVLVQAVSDGAAAVWVRNAVDDAIAGVGMLAERGIEADLLHARFALCDRMRHEAGALARFGKDREPRPGRVLVATQVVESSLDLDFDVMVSDLAPVPALVQRAGRLWRHMDRRPASTRPRPEPVLHVLSPDPDYVTDAHWLRRVLDRGAFTYPVDLQWRAARALFAAGQINAPEGLRALIEAGLTGGDLPEPLEEAEMARQAEGFAATDLARQNLIDLSATYRNIKGFSDDSEFPTRLGQEQQVLVLARMGQGGLAPWSGGSWKVDSFQLSEVTASRRKLERLPLPDQAEPQIAAIKDGWPEWRQARLIVCPVTPEGTICEGLSYDAERGLLIE